jgi:hypothetical protein
MIKIYVNILRVYVDYFMVINKGNQVVNKEQHRKAILTQQLKLAE